jgi:cell division protein FtsQ
MPRVKASPRALMDRPSRAAMLLRRLRRWMGPIVWAGAAFAILLLVAMEMRSVSSGGALSAMRDAIGSRLGLRLEHVIVEGRGNTPEPLLNAAIGATRGSSLLGYSVAAARARIQTLSWVENASVERRLPDTLVVKLTERSPFAIWQNQKKFILIDRNGQVVADQDVAAYSNLPLVVGPDAPAHAAEMLDLLAQYPAIQAKLAAIVRVGGRRWNLHLATGGDVLLPEGHETEALARLAQLQASDSLLDRPLAVVDMRLPDRLVIRPRTDAHDATASPKKST